MSAIKPSVFTDRIDAMLNAGGWIPVMPETMPDERRKILVTNNINALNAHGEMSHVWLVSMIHKPNSEHEDFTAYTDWDFLLRNITHYKYPLPPLPEDK